MVCTLLLWIELWLYEDTVVFSVAKGIAQEHRARLRDHLRTSFIEALRANANIRPHTVSIKSAFEEDPPEKVNQIYMYFILQA